MKITFISKMLTLCLTAMLTLPAGAVDTIKNISTKLSDQGWESVVTVNSADEQVRIFMKLNDEAVDGITVMAVEENEAVFVNIIGDINPEELSKVIIAGFGGANELIDSAEKSYREKKYNLTAKLLSYVLAVEPENKRALQLIADAL